MIRLLKKSSIILIIAIFHALLESLKAQGGCGNPISKLYADVKILGVAVDYKEKFIECKDVLSVTCCEDEYHKNMATKFIELKQEQLDKWDLYFSEKATAFIKSYTAFLTWYDTNEKGLDKNQMTADVEYYTNLVSEIEEEKNDCFEEIWRHTASMKCLVCLSDYSSYFQQLRNKTIEMYMNENVCQVIQEKCTVYVGKYVYLAEKAKYLFTWIRKALKVPNYSDKEILQIAEFDKYITPMYTCKSTSICRGLCSNFLTGTGFSANYTQPTILYLEWFVDGFRTIQKQKALGLLTSRVLSNDFDILDISEQTRANEHTRILSGMKLEQKHDRILLTAFEKLQLQQKSYISAPIYSNSYTLNTLVLANKVLNVTFTDAPIPLKTNKLRWYLSLSLLIFPLLLRI